MAMIPAARDEEYSVETRYALPAHLLVKIEPFSLLAKRGIQEYESSVFEAGGYKWKFILSTEGEYISVQLAICDTCSLPVGWEVNAMFNVFLHNQILDTYLCFRAKARRFHVTKPKWHLSKLISKNFLTEPSNGYLIDDNCVFGAEVFVIKGRPVVESLSMEKVPDRHKQTFEITNFSGLKSDWVSEEFSFCECKWKVEVDPCGESVSIFLHCVDVPNCKRVMPDYHFCLKNQLNDIESISVKGSKWFDAPLAWGWPDFISIKDMQNPSRGFLVEDRCVLEVKMTVLAISDTANTVEQVTPIAEKDV